MNSILLLVVSTTLLAAEPKVTRDISYVESANDSQKLDIYAPAAGEKHPIVVWIHGGGWRGGNKEAVQKKPQAFTAQGFLFVSINYRLIPKVTVKEMATDIAQAIQWTREHATEYGGDPDSILVAGHSAGAHLAALICTDESYLRAAGVTFKSIKGCIPVDTAAYDVPQQVAAVQGVRAAMYTSVFRSDKKSQQLYSPVSHVAKDANIPPFCILHVADRPDSTAQTTAFAKVLTDAGVKVVVVPGAGKNHGTINSELGLAADKPTIELFRFLEEVLGTK